MADSEFKQQVLAATDMVQLVSQSVALKQRGAKWVGLCPFHQEKTPSFYVDPARGYFKCFGCKEGGNAIDFVMKRDRLDFLDALRQLAEAAGLEMPRFGVSKQKTSEKQALLEIHSKAAEYFHRMLLSPAGEPARKYLESRGFTPATITAHRLGYVPVGWDNLLRSREMAGVNPGLMALGGLAKARDTTGGKAPGFYDTFRNRLMFPIRDETGKVIAFGGRVMPGSDDPAKYLNSPETPLFSKSRSVYGLDLARQRIVETRTVAVVEGYTDVVMAHQFGASNVVSILGTAMTEQHLNTLRRFADRVVLLFDADTAGETAVNRSIDLFLKFEIEIAIATLPDELDPDEFLLRDGLGAFDALLRNAEDALSFKWRSLQKEIEAAGSSVTASSRATEQYLELLARSRGDAGTAVNELRWGAVLRRVERLTGIPIEQLNRRFPMQHGGGPRGSVRFQASSPSSPPNGRVQQGPVSAEAGSRKPVIPISEARRRAERWILGVLLADPSRWLHVQSLITPESFRDPELQVLAERFWERVRNEGEPTFAEFLGELNDGDGGEQGAAVRGGLRNLAVDLLEEVEKNGDLEATLSSAFHLFETENALSQLQNLRRQVESKKEDEQEIDVLRKLQQQMGKPNPRRLPPGF
jgi:DNA primase